MIVLTCSCTDLFPCPSFKTRTIHFGYGYIFGNHGNSLLYTDPLYAIREEFGTSMSLDGFYLERPCFRPGITLGFPLEQNKDIPKFYINQFGQKQIARNILLDSTTFIHEAEIKYPYELDQNTILWAVIHLDKKEMEKEATKQDGLWKLQAEHSLKVIEAVEDRFRILEKVPETDFKIRMREFYPAPKNWFKENCSGNYVEIFEHLEKMVKPYNKMLCSVYKIDYRYIIASAKQSAMHYQNQKKK